MKVFIVRSRFKGSSDDFTYFERCFDSFEKCRDFIKNRENQNDLFEYCFSPIDVL